MSPEASLADELRLRRQTALRFARLQHDTGAAVWHNLCQKFVRTALGAPPGAPSAKAAWQGTDKTQRRGRGELKPPAGVPCYFRLDTPYWHATLSAGNGYVWTNDVVRRGKIDKVSIRYIENRWNAHYLGWTTHINGRRVW